MTDVKTGRVSAPIGRSWWLAGGMLGLAFGYFFWYTPYAALTKALSSGLLPGIDSQIMDPRIGGLVLLPAAALGTVTGAAIFLGLSGWWRHIGTRQAFGRMLRLPSPTMLLAGFFMALVIATTTLNYTFAGVSILFMLLMMRAGVLILSPVVDTVRRRRVRVYSWAALGFSLLAVTAALADVNSYHLVIGAVLSLSLYFTGYIGRFQIMSKVAKSSDESVNRRYFAEELAAAAGWQVVLCAVLALVGLGSVSDALAAGFTSFLFSSAMLPAFGIGLLYSALYVYGTLIYLDPREYTWCVPTNRCSSLLSGLVGSFLLTWLTGIALPGTGQFIATGFVALAIASLSYPTLKALVVRPRADEVVAVVAADARADAPVVPVRADDAAGAREAGRRPLLLFVCKGNTCRSAMAEAIVRGELAASRIADRWRVLSAGISASAGTPMQDEARRALQSIGVSVNGHQARQLTPELITEADAVYCMTEAQRAAVLAMAPHAAGKISRIDPAADLPDPHGKQHEAYLDCAELIRYAVRSRMADLVDSGAPSRR